MRAADKNPFWVNNLAYIWLKTVYHIFKYDFMPYKVRQESVSQVPRMGSRYVPPQLSVQSIPGTCRRNSFVELCRN